MAACCQRWLHTASRCLPARSHCPYSLSSLFCFLRRCAVSPKRTALRLCYSVVPISRRCRFGNTAMERRLQFVTQKAVCAKSGRSHPPHEEMKEQQRLRSCCGHKNKVKDMHHKRGPSTRASKQFHEILCVVCGLSPAGLPRGWVVIVHVSFFVNNALPLCGPFLQGNHAVHRTEQFAWHY